ncbi:hypothetical protein OAA27_01635 [bacterium]|nr:hypothetical protein [bacterium]
MGLYHFAAMMDLPTPKKRGHLVWLACLNPIAATSTRASTKRRHRCAVQKTIQRSGHTETKQGQITTSYDPSASSEFF